MNSMVAFGMGVQIATNQHHKQQEPKRHGHTK